MNENQIKPRFVDYVAKLRLLTPTQAPIGYCNWGVYAFILNRDIVREDGTVDEIYAVIIHLGSFNDEKQAGEHARHIIELTGYRGLMVCKYGQPSLLKSKYDINEAEDVFVDPKGNLMKFQDSEYQESKRVFEEQQELRRKIDHEIDNESDSHHIEHFKRQCFVAIKTHSEYMFHKQKCEEALLAYEKRRCAVQEHYQAHPEHEEQWLPYLKEKLEGRGEDELYQTISLGYQNLREDLLGLEKQ